MTKGTTTRGNHATGMSYQDILDTDRCEPPATYRWQSSSSAGPVEVPVSRYLSVEAHRLEKEYLWSRVWQIACRAEQLTDVGDAAVYDIADKSYLLVRAADGPDGVRAFPNACLHRGRALRDGPGRVSEIQCTFHGFCWSLEGKLRRIPSAWDFPHLEPHSLTLPRVHVGQWGGFVFINPDPDCEPLAEYLGVLPELFTRWPLDQRYTKAHVSKVINANWKVVQEAFMESYHVVTTHPQLLPGFGDANSQYDVFGNVARAMSPRGVPSPLLAWNPTEQQQLDSALDVRQDDPAIFALGEGGRARHALADAAAAALRPHLGDSVECLSEAELVDSYFVDIFPNAHPWAAYNQIFYRFRPNGDDHRSALMEVMLLAPYSGERPMPAAEIRLGAQDAWRDATDVLGSLARVFDQDEFNLEAVQRGLHSTQRAAVNLAAYQESKIRHFHELYEQWVPELA
ncbi:SRPBCC family protein [Mycobacterium sp. AZCC_0083]|uniref:aromatic ring-hydroxylating oxygenase subunit alpha n=1 Tax=Mycobacterium sp. AZCC_0083 TaxID=2735882 RepID=UPI0016119DCC|nr:aromatic ring-hydroxylating dioxygenase subunit alpha [Mycobacterium sp. AZCC_0083]MBB5164019.1 phenylpropionate dioxygenase-like ring-hydroxylating dioxygenase large terminal subunit [Mycobacterium sp. AZCC_0083]